jgi:hypothetical protein
MRQISSGSKIRYVSNSTAPLKCTGVFPRGTSFLLKKDLIAE